MANTPISIQFSATDLPVAGITAEAFIAPQEGQPLSFDNAARSYVAMLLEGRVTERFSAAVDALEGRPPALKFSGLTQQALTDTVVAEYEQTHKGIPLYGQPVGVEMKRDASFVGFGGSLGIPVNINPIATISPREALMTVRAIAGLKSFEALPGIDAPNLVFRFEPRWQEWNLVYLFEGVPIHEEAGESQLGKKLSLHEHPGTGHFMSFYRVFVDAHSGLEVARVPLRKTVRVSCTFNDVASGKTLTFESNEEPAGTFTLFDPVRKIRTMSLGFSDINCGPIDLPGQLVSVTGGPGTIPQFVERAAIFAHCNAAKAFDFFKNILKRNSIDDRGMEIVSVVDCADYRFNGYKCGPQNPIKKEYKNAAWIRDNRLTACAPLRTGLMVYGQTNWASDGQLHSFAEALDVVAHELTHGITDYTCDLEYRTESGALNESYSDIIGVAISNASVPAVDRWNWDLGEELSSDGAPTRSIKDPLMGKGEFSFDNDNQPVHMRDFIRLSPGEPPSRSNDNGYVHYNSGIHNKAAFNLFTDGTFTWQQVVQMYYLTLTTPGRLSKSATFSESKDGMIASCKVLFQDLPTDQRNVRVQAVAKAFEDVGIA